MTSTGENSSGSNHPRSENYLSLALGGSTAISANELNLNHIHTQSLGHQRIGPVEVSTATQDFVEPECYSSIKKQLFRRHVVVLCSERGLGQWTAALKLVSDLYEAKRNEAPLIDTWRLKPSGLEPRLNTIPRIKQHALILDLSDNTDKIENGKDLRPKVSFAAGLKDYSEQLKLDKSFLIIIVSPQAWEYCREAAYDETFQWTPPTAQSIITARLRGRLKCEERVSWLDDQRYRRLLENSPLIPPAEAVRLAESIARAKEDDSGKDPKDIALDAFGRWSEHLRLWFRDNENVFDRAVLIAAAVLGKTRAQDIVDAAESLLASTGEPNSEKNPLRSPDLVEQLANTGAAIGDDDTVNLNEYRPDFDEAIVAHVWKQRPYLREPLKEWLVVQATDKHATDQRRRRIAQVIARLGRRYNAGLSVVNFVTKFAENGPKHHDLAVEILDETVLDPTIGSYVRQRLLGWTSLRTTPVLLSLTAAVCGKRLGRERTDLALNRLAKILANPCASQEVLDIAGSTLNELALEDGRRTVVLYTVADLLRNSPQAGAKAFLRLVHVDTKSVVPLFLEDARQNSEVRSILVGAWKSAYAAVGPEECARSMRSWFANIGKCLHEDMVLDVCLPVLRADVDKSLAASVFENISNRRIFQTVMRRLVPAINDAEVDE